VARAMSSLQSSSSKTTRARPGHRDAGTD
jgi:hypothetical protein